MKILVIGPGLIGKKHIDLIANSKEMILEAVVAPHLDRYRDVTQKYSVPVYPDLDTALQERNYDAVVISSPNEFHYTQAKQCLDNGLPVLLEKPLTTSLSEAKELVELAEMKGVPFLVADHRLYNPLLYTAKEFVASEGFGRIVSFMGSAQFYKPESYFKKGPWRTKKGGGPILINLIHEIGIMRTLCGEISKVSAFASNRIREFEVEDTVSISLEFENGALGTFMLSDTAVSNKSWEMTTGENPAYPHHPNEWTYHIAGTKASLDFPKMTMREYDAQHKASWWSPFNNGQLDVTHKNPLVVQLDHFADVLRGNPNIISSARNGYLNMIVVEAVKRSIDEQRVVNIKDEKFE